LRRVREAHVKRIGIRRGGCQPNALGGNKGQIRLDAARADLGNIGNILAEYRLLRRILIDNRGLIIGGVDPETGDISCQPAIS
jgi:hypothetical protein